MALVLMPELLKGLGLSGGWQLILFGLGAINYAKHPEGVIEPQTRASIEFLQRKIDRRKQRRAGTLDLTGDDEARPAAGHRDGEHRAMKVARLLEATDITKRFSGITALDSVTLDVDAGEAVGLIGPNGAGKTTFFNCLLGILRPEAAGSASTAATSPACPCTGGRGWASGARSSASSCSPA